VYCTNIWKRFLIVIFLFIIFSLTAQTNSVAGEKQIIVVFRYDDYSSLSSTDLEVRLINTFQKYKIAFTFGVVPFTVSNHLNTSPQNVFPLSQSKAMILRNAMKDGTLEIAQHGYSHQTVSEKGIYSEFYGLNYDSQLQKIEKGKIFLEEILHAEISTFIPPFNSYDLNTVRVLEKLGFKCISSSIDGDATEFSNLYFLPKTCSLLQLQNAIKAARMIRDPQPIIVVLLHEYDFLEIDKGRGTFTYQEFLDVVNWLASQKDIHMMSINQAIHAISDLSAKRFLMNHAAKSSLHFMPLFLRNSGLNNSGLYFSSSDSLEIRDRNRIHIILFYFMILVISIIISFYTGFFMFHKSGHFSAPLRYGLIFLLIFFSIYTFQDLDIGYKGAMVITMLCGMCIGVWGSFFIIRKQNRLKQMASSFKS
jgi:peptidoglycan/xylan/chitin deacetylase (PgdA/CDA1 family)